MNYPHEGSDEYEGSDGQEWSDIPDGISQEDMRNVYLDDLFYEERRILRDTAALDIRSTDPTFLFEGNYVRFPAAYAGQEVSFLIANQKIKTTSVLTVRVWKDNMPYLYEVQTVTDLQGSDIPKVWAQVVAIPECADQTDLPSPLARHMQAMETIYISGEEEMFPDRFTPSSSFHFCIPDVLHILFERQYYVIKDRFAFFIHVKESDLAFPLSDGRYLILPQLPTGSLCLDRFIVVDRLRGDERIMEMGLLSIDPDVIATDCIEQSFLDRLHELDVLVHESEFLFSLGGTDIPLDTGIRGKNVAIVYKRDNLAVLVVHHWKDQEPWIYETYPLCGAEDLARFAGTEISLAGEYNLTNESFPLQAGNFIAAALEKRIIGFCFEKKWYQVDIEVHENPWLCLPDGRYLRIDSWQEFYGGKGPFLPEEHYFKLFEEKSVDVIALEVIPLQEDLRKLNLFKERLDTLEKLSGEEESQDSESEGNTD